MKKSKARMLLNEGLEHHNNGRYDEAIKSYTKIMKFRQDFIWAYSNRGLAYIHKGEYDEAIKDFTKTIMIAKDHLCYRWTGNDTGYASAYNNRGLAYYNKGEYDEAIKDYTKSIKRYTKIIKEAIKVMNLSLNRREHDDKSIDNIKKDFTRTYNNRGNAYLKKGENALAILDYNKSIEINPNYTHVYYNRGLAYNNKGEYDEAIKDFTKCLEIDPNYSKAQERIERIRESK